MKTEEYLHELSSSDLSIEEKLASGASISDLISAGVLHDDYSAGHDFTEEEEVVEEEYDEPPMSQEDIDSLKARLRWGIDVHRLGKDAPPRPV